MKKIFTLLLLCVLCIGSAWGEDYTELFTIKSADVVTNSGYAKYETTVGKCGWIITFGGNNKSVGTNSSNRSKCNLSSYVKYAVSPISQTDICSVFANTTQINDVSKISYTFNGGSNQSSTNVYLIYSADGNKFSQISLTSGTQGAAISSGTAFEFAECSGYFGLLFKATNSSGNWRIDDVNVTFYEKKGTSPTTEKELIAIHATGTPAEFWKGDEFNHNGITVTALWDDDSETDVTSSCTFSGYDMSVAGEQTVTATYQGETCTYGIEVNTIANTPETAYTVAQAKALIDAGKDLSTPVYVKGTVSKIVTAFDANYGNISFNVSAEGETTGDQFQFYRNFKGADKTKWTSADEAPKVGDYVIGYGTLTKYGSTYEFAEGNYIVSSNKLATLSIADITVANGEDIVPVITTNVTGEYAIEYTSDNEEVVLAADDEMVTMGIGTAIITAYMVADGYKDAETTFTVTVTSAATLTGIAISGTLTKTEYTIGDAFDKAGLSATANYSDGTTADVTANSEWTISPETFTTAGENIEVSVAATFNGIKSETSTFNVKVNKKAASIAIEDIKIGVGGEANIVATTTPANADLSYEVVEGGDYVTLSGAKVTGVTIGTATIKASFAGNDEYDAAETTFTVTVSNDQSVTYNFAEFTSAKEVVLSDLDGFTITLNNGGGTYPAWSSNQARLYAKGSLTVKADNATITSIVYNYTVNANKNNVAPTIDGAEGKTNAGTWDADGKIWTGSDSEVTLSTSGTAGNLGFTSLTITYASLNKTETSLEWSAAEATVTINGNDNVFPTLTTNPSDLEGVTYSSSNTDVATIDANGNIELLADGETTITASYAGNDIYMAAASVSYTLTVNPEVHVLTPVDMAESVDFTQISPYKELGTNGSATMEQYNGTSFEISFAKPQSTSTPTKYYQNGNAVRAYKDNTMTIRAAEPIAMVQINYVEDYLDDEVSVSTGKTSNKDNVLNWWINDGETTEVTLTSSKTSRFTSIIVYYKAYTREGLTVNNLGTICLPGAVKADDYTGATFYAIAGKLTDDGTETGTPTQVKFTEVTDLQAGVPYVFIASDETITAKYDLKTALVTSPNNDNTNGLYGTLTRYAFADDANYDENYYIINSKNQIQAATVNSGVVANRAFIKMDEVPMYTTPAAGVKVLTIGYDGFDVEEVPEPNAINSISPDKKQNEGAIYNLNGQRLNSLQKGINIVNGKKVYIR